MPSLINPALLNRFDDRPDVKRRLVKIYLETAPENVSGVESASAGREFSGVIWHAHALKGASLAVGAERLAALSDQLGRAAKSEDPQQIDPLVSLLMKCWVRTADALGKLIEN
ncbi:MAG: Hpt domain-containing protein [Xanthomonadales bacterium]|nr:Hpt domain-containing protein [Xanthomonadales bacterium]